MHLMLIGMYRRLQILYLLLRPGSPNPNGFCVADPPVALKSQSIGLYWPIRSILPTVEEQCRGPGPRNNMLLVDQADTTPRLAPYTSTFNEFL